MALLVFVTDPILTHFALTAVPSDDEQTSFLPHGLYPGLKYAGSLI